MTNLLATGELAINWLDKGTAVDPIYLNYSRAFDSFNHRLLLAKLKGYCIDLTVIHWAYCFLSRLTFQISVREALIPMAEAISGVSQGSVIGPEQFVICVNDIPALLAADDSLIYADDVKLAPHNHHYIFESFLIISPSFSKDW